MKLPKRDLLLVSGDVNNETTATVFELLSKAKGRAVSLVISSSGGDELQGYAIYDLLRTYPGRVTTYCLGICESTALLVFLAGEKRLVYPTSTLMLHHGTTQVPKTHQQEFIRYAQETKRTDALYMDLIAERTGQPLKRVLRWARFSKYFPPNEALRYGFAHSLVS